MTPARDPKQHLEGFALIFIQKLMVSLCVFEISTKKVIILLCVFDIRASKVVCFTRVNFATPYFTLCF